MDNYWFCSAPDRTIWDNLNLVLSDEFEEEWNNYLVTGKSDYKELCDKVRSLMDE